MKVMFVMNQGRDGLLAGLFLMILSAFLALPSLGDAWWHDPYSAGGFLAFLVWLSSFGTGFGRPRHPGGEGNTWWIVLSALLCAAGSITSLRVCHHLALACALCSLAAPKNEGWLVGVSALSWLPASGWFISRFSPGGLVGWERPTAAATAVLILLIRLHRNSRHSSDEAQS